MTTPLPAARTKIDTLLIPGGDGAQSARYDEVLIRWIRAAAKNSRASRRCAAARSSVPRPDCWTVAP